MATEVRTAADLNNVRNNLSGDYIQMADIDLKEWGNWTPIGGSFTGIYNGGGYKIINLTISGGEKIGLFSTLNGATINRVGLVSVSISGVKYIGALAGFLEGAKSTIRQCYSTGSIAGSDWHIGGLFGINGQGLFVVGDTSTDVIDCYSMCSISGLGDVSGIMGFAYQGPDMTTFKNCYFGGTVAASWSGGYYKSGIACSYTAAAGYSPSYEVNMENCYYDSDKNGVLSVWQGTPRTTTEMTYPENFTTTYINWDFIAIWRHDASYILNEGYPVFGGFNIWVKKSPNPSFLPPLWLDWKTVPVLWVYKEFEWKSVTGVWIKKGDEWKTV